MQQFELYWQEVHIGTLTKNSWDMRSSGTIDLKLHQAEASSAIENIKAYINYSVASSKYLDAGDEEKYYKMCAEETKYLSLINSTGWKLINDKGENIKVLCPIFHENNEITWQLMIKK